MFLNPRSILYLESLLAYKIIDVPGTVRTTFDLQLHAHVSTGQGVK